MLLLRIIHLQNSILDRSELTEVRFDLFHRALLGDPSNEDLAIDVVDRASWADVADRNLGIDLKRA
jgi:hypothetical protein